MSGPHTEHCAYGLPAGSLNAEAMAMRFLILISRAFNTFNNDQIVGLPKWADTERFDIIAKAPAGGSRVWHEQRCFGPDDARPAGRPLQNDLPHREPCGLNLPVSIIEDEEG
jgi:hypothetical protein